MLHAAAHRRLDQGARLDRIVEIVAERIGDGIRHHDLGGEMRDGLDAVLADRPRDQVLIAHVAGDERRLGGQAQAKPVDRLSSTTTSSPASSRASTMWLPI